MSCYNAPVGSIYRLNKYGYDRVYLLLGHVGNSWPARECVDLQTGGLSGFSKGSAFDTEAEQIS